MADKIRLQGLEHVIQVTAHEGKVYLRSYRLDFPTSYSFLFIHSFSHLPHVPSYHTSILFSLLSLPFSHPPLFLSINSSFHLSLPLSLHLTNPSIPSSLHFPFLHYFLFPPFLFPSTLHPSFPSSFSPINSFDPYLLFPSPTINSFYPYLLFLFPTHQFLHLSLHLSYPSLPPLPYTQLYFIFRVLLKKSGTKTPRVELEEIGPSFDLVKGRSKLASVDLWKRAVKKPKTLKVLCFFSV